MVFPVVLYGCESWTIKKAECWRIDAFELRCCRTLESPLNCKEIQTVSPKGNQSWIFIGRTYAEAEAPILWLPDAENWLIGKYPDAWKDWRQEKGTTEDEMFGLFHEMDAQLYELQHVRPPYLSPTPGVYPNPSPLSRWYHPAISSSVIPFSSCPQSLPASESFPMSQLFASGSQSIGASASTSVLPMNTQDWSPLG